MDNQDMEEQYTKNFIGAGKQDIYLTATSLPAIENDILPLIQKPEVGENH